MDRLGSTFDYTKTVDLFMEPRPRECIDHRGVPLQRCRTLKLSLLALGFVDSKPTRDDLFIELPRNNYTN